MLCGAAHSSAMLIVGRVVAGLGASGIIGGSFTIISASVPLEKRPPLIGACMGIAQLGQVIGPLIGGAFTTGYTWRWSFYINLPLGAVVVVPLFIIRISEQMPKQPASKIVGRLPHFLDLVGFALFAPAVVMFLLALQYGGNQNPWNSSVVIGLFVGAFANAVVWLIWNWYKGDDALIPVSMAKRRIVWISSLNYGLFMSLVFGGVFYLPIYFQAIKGKSAILSGVMLLPNIIPQLVSTIGGGVLRKCPNGSPKFLAGRVHVADMQNIWAVGKVGRIPPFALFAAAVTAIGSGLYGTFQPNTSTGKWVGYQILAGFGQGIGFQMVRSSTARSRRWPYSCSQSPRANIILFSPWLLSKMTSSQSTWQRPPRCSSGPNMSAPQSSSCCTTPFSPQACGRRSPGWRPTPMPTPSSQQAPRDSATSSLRRILGPSWWPTPTPSTTLSIWSLAWAPLPLSQPLAWDGGTLGSPSPVLTRPMWLRAILLMHPKTPVQQR